MPYREFWIEEYGKGGGAGLAWHRDFSSTLGTIRVIERKAVNDLVEALEKCPCWDGHNCHACETLKRWKAGLEK